MEQRILLSASQTGYDSYAQALRLVGAVPAGRLLPPGGHLVRGAYFVRRRGYRAAPLRPALWRH